MPADRPEAASPVLRCRKGKPEHTDRNAQGTGKGVLVYGSGRAQPHARSRAVCCCNPSATPTAASPPACERHRAESGGDHFEVSLTGTNGLHLLQFDCALLEVRLFRGGSVASSVSLLTSCAASKNGCTPGPVADGYDRAFQQSRSLATARNHFHFVATAQIARFRTSG